MSVVIPAFNPGPFLKEALSSVVAQTFHAWDAVVVDDGSTEDLSWITGVDPRVRSIRQNNAGLSAARNAGIAAATGDLVAFLDADDVWLPTKLERQVKELSGRPELQMLSTAFEIIDERGHVVGPGYEGHNSSYESLLTGNGVCVSTSIVRRNTLIELGGFDTSLASVQDWDLWLRVARRGRIDRLDDVLAQYRIHSGSMSQNWRRTYLEACEVLRRHHHPASRKGRRRARELACWQAIDQARVAARKHDWARMLRATAFVAKHQPRMALRAARQAVATRLP